MHRYGTFYHWRVTLWFPKTLHWDPNLSREANAWTEFRIEMHHHESRLEGSSEVHRKGVLRELETRFHSEGLRSAHAAAGEQVINVSSGFVQ